MASKRNFRPVTSHEVEIRLCQEVQLLWAFPISKPLPTQNKEGRDNKTQVRLASQMASALLIVMGSQLKHLAGHSELVKVPQPAYLVCLPW